MERTNTLPVEEVVEQRQRGLPTTALSLRQPIRAFLRTKPLFRATLVPSAPFVAIAPYRVVPAVRRLRWHKTWVVGEALVEEAPAAAVDTVAVGFE